MNDFNKVIGMGVLLTAGVALTAYSESSKAQTYASTGSHIYLGGNYGGFKSRGGSFEDDNDFLEAYAGFRLNSFFGIEASYLNFGEYGNDLASAKLDGYAFSAVGNLPLSNTIDLYAKIGMFYSEVELELAGFETSTDDDQLFYGLGAAFAIAEPLRLVVEYNRFKVEVEDDDSFPGPLESNSTDIDALKLGLRYAFY